MINLAFIKFIHTYFRNIRNFHCVYIYRSWDCRIYYVMKVGINSMQITPSPTILKKMSTDLEEVTPALLLVIYFPISDSALAPLGESFD